MKSKSYVWVLVVAIIVLAAYVRFNDLGSTIFLGDQNRDMMRTLGIVEARDLPLTGAELSVMYRNASIGPIQYYIMAPFMFISKSPVFMSFSIALLNVVAVALTFFFTRKYFGVRAAAIASALFAVSTTAVLRSSLIWNPSFFAFVVILFFYSVFSFVFDRKSSSFVWLMASLAVVTQFQAVMNVFFVVAAAVIILWRPSIKKKHLILGVAVFLLLYSPYIYNELVNGFPNSRALLFYASKTSEQGGSPKGFDYRVFEFPHKIITRSRDIFGRSEKALFVGGSLFVLVGGVFFYFKKSSRETAKKYVLLVAWLALPIIFWSVFNQQLLEHYFIPLYPVQFILIGIFAGWLWKNADRFSPDFFKPFVSIVFVVFFSVMVCSQAQSVLNRSESFFSYKYVVPAVEGVLQDANFDPLVVENNVRYCSANTITLGFEYLFYYYGSGKFNIGEKNDSVYVFFDSNLTAPSKSDVHWVKENKYGYYVMTDLVAFNAWRSKLPEEVKCRCVMRHQNMSPGGLCHRDKEQQSLFV